MRPSIGGGDERDLQRRVVDVPAERGRASKLFTGGTTGVSSGATSVSKTARWAIRSTSMTSRRDSSASTFSSIRAAALRRGTSTNHELARTGTAFWSTVACSCSSTTTRCACTAPGLPPPPRGSWVVCELGRSPGRPTIRSRRRSVGSSGPRSSEEPRRDSRVGRRPDAGSLSPGGARGRASRCRARARGRPPTAPSWDRDGEGGTPRRSRRRWSS